MMYQTNPPKPPQETLPTMYDLPSEDPEEPGLPDEFHEFQPQLLRETFHSSVWTDDRVFIGTDINLYYDSRHTLWYKRPDWFLVLGVFRPLQQEDLRLSYVIWQEGVAPFLVIELLSPGTAGEDLGQTLREVDQPPTKWEVYERTLRVPYYVVFDRYVNQFRAFRLEGMQYQELSCSDSKLWIEDLQLGLGIWQGQYELAEGQWLRWYDAEGRWLPTRQERAEQERHRAEQERHRAEQVERELEQERERSRRLAERLRSLGIDPNEL